MDDNLLLERKRPFLSLAGRLFASITIFIGGMVIGIALWVPARNEVTQLITRSSASGPRTVSRMTLFAVPALAAGPQPTTAHPPAAMAANAVLPSPATEPDTALPRATRDAFCLQLGSFENAEYARKLQSDLEHNGIKASIVDHADSAQHSWHTVRVDGYNTFDAASQAAADFSSRWRVRALVRRSDRL